MDALSKIPDIYCMVGTTGDYDLHVWALIRDIEHLLKIQREIVSIPDFGTLDVQLTTTSRLDIYPGRRQYITTI
jgi:DNA-binding Lrp family transcriptional regulator